MTSSRDFGTPVPGDESSPGPTEPRTVHVSAAVVVDKRGRLLLVRKAGTTAFMQPGGKPEPGESASETLRRELKEELAVEVDEDSVRPLGSFTAAAANEPGYTVVADVFEVDLGAQVPTIGAEIAELRWVGSDDVAGIEIAPLARENFLRG